MKSFISYTAALGLAVTLGLSLPATAAETEAESDTTTDVVQSTAMSKEQDRQYQMEHKFEKAEKYYAECINVPEGRFEEIRPFLKAFTDVEVMVDMMSDPVKFAQLMDVVNDPHTMHVMMKCSTEPVMWDTWVRGLGDYNKMMRAMVRFMDPAMYMRWMMAPMNPQVWAPMFRFMDPNYYTKWMVAMMNPTFYQPFYAFMDPNWYTPRLQWMMDPQSFAPLYSAFTSVQQPSAQQPNN